MRTVDDVRLQIGKEDVPFCTIQVVDNSGFVDFIFIGNYKGDEVIWNTRLTTTKGDYYNTIEQLASDDAFEAYPLPDDAIDLNNMFEKIEGTKYSRIINRYPELTNQRAKFRAERMMDLLDSKTIMMDTWNISIDESYEFGIGLHARVDVDSFNERDVIDFIDMFNISGLDMFEGSEGLLTCMTADELGVELYKDKLVIWSDGSLHNDVAIKPGFFDNDEDYE